MLNTFKHSPSSPKPKALTVLQEKKKKKAFPIHVPLNDNPT